jgi:hypothetical protein
MYSRSIGKLVAPINRIMNILTQAHSSLCHRIPLYRVWHRSKYHQYAHRGVLGVYIACTILKVAFIFVISGGHPSSLLADTQTWTSQSDWGNWTMSSTSNTVTPGSLTLSQSGGGGGVSYVASENAVGGFDGSYYDPNPITINKPSGTVSGHVMIANISGANGYTFSSVPSGWTLITSVNSGDNYTLKAYYKVAGGSEPSSYTWSAQSSSDTFTGVISTYSGVDTADPIDDYSSAVGSSNTVSLGAITLTNANSYLQSTYYSYNSGAFWSTPSGYTQLVNVDNSYGGSFASFNKSQTSSGSSGGVNSTHSSSGDNGVGILLGLQPSVATYSSSGYASINFDSTSAGTTWNSLTRSQTLNSQTATYYAKTSADTSCTNAGTWSGWSTLSFSGNVATLSLSTSRYVCVGVALSTGNTAVSPSIESLVLDYALASSTNPITTMSAIGGNNSTNATGVRQTVSFVTVTSTVDGCVKLDFDTGATLTGSSGDVFVDWSNSSGGTQVTTGTITYNTGAGATVLVPFTGTLAVPKIVTVIVGSITNGSTAGTQAIVVGVYANSTCTGTAQDEGTVNYTLVRDSISQNVKVGRALTYTLSGNTTHQYVVDPASNTTDTNANTVSVLTNADSYEVRIYNTQALTAGANTLSDTFGGTRGTPAALSGGASSTGFGYNLSSVVGSSTSGYSNYAAFTNSAPSTGEHAVLSKSTPTGNTANSAIVTYKVGVDYTVRPGDYTTTTKYVVAPSYN